jgi:hypothetical protein
MTFLKLNMNLIPSNPTNVVESLIWNTLIPSRLELPDDIYDSDDNKSEEDEEEGDEDEDDDLSPIPMIESEKADYSC